MNYEKHILDAFARLEYSPRDGQVEAVDKILSAFVDHKKKNVILSAPTGSGKSIIGAVSAEALSEISGKHNASPKSSILITATNALAKQYYESFSSLEKKGLFLMLKGASNYGCSALTTPEEEVTAASCAFYTFIRNKNEFADVIEKHCNQCEFLITKNRKNSVRHLITNYSYFFIDRMYTEKFEKRDLVVWDEAHLVNDLFSEHNAIYFSEKQLTYAMKDIAETVQLTDIEIANILRSVLKDIKTKNKINDSNYKSYLIALNKVYKYAAERGNKLQETALRSGKISTYNKLVRFTKTYEGKFCKIDDLFNYEYDHIFEYKEDEHSVSVKPIFVGKMIDSLQAADHNLYMSATASDEILKTSLNLKEDETEYIKLPPVFPKSNKEIVFFDPISLNYANMKKQDTIDRLLKNVRKIVNKHISENERGIILAPSFKMCQLIANELKSDKSIKLFEHRQGEKAENILNAFISSKSKTAVLISPSVFEGVDLPGNLSRFQIIVKAPYPSLGDKRVKYILDNYPSIYNIMTTMKIVQGAGRSVRSIDDHAVTYMLDLNGQRLFNSSQNVWKDEFNLRFTKFL